MGYLPPYPQYFDLIPQFLSLHKYRLYVCEPTERDNGVEQNKQLGAVGHEVLGAGVAMR